MCSSSVMRTLPSGMSTQGTCRSMSTTRMTWASSFSSRGLLDKNVLILAYPLPSIDPSTHFGFSSPTYRCGSEPAVLKAPSSSSTAPGTARHPNLWIPPKTGHHPPCRSPLSARHGAHFLMHWIRLPCVLKVSSEVQPSPRQLQSQSGFLSSRIPLLTTSAAGK